jgi:hypothetical protein
MQFDTKNNYNLYDNTKVIIARFTTIEPNYEPENHFLFYLIDEDRFLMSIYSNVSVSYKLKENKMYNGNEYIEPLSTHLYISSDNDFDCYHDIKPYNQNEFLMYIKLSEIYWKKIVDRIDIKLKYDNNISYGNCIYDMDDRYIFKEFHNNWKFMYDMFFEFVNESKNIFK